LDYRKLRIMPIKNARAADGCGFRTLDYKKLRIMPIKNVRAADGCGFRTLDYRNFERERDLTGGIDGKAVPRALRFSHESAHVGVEISQTDVAGGF
jgi:hypothetical protein